MGGVGKALTASAKQAALSHIHIMLRGSCDESSYLSSRDRNDDKPLWKGASVEKEKSTENTRLSVMYIVHYFSPFFLSFSTQTIQGTATEKPHRIPHLLMWANS